MLKKILAVLGAVSSTLEDLQYAWSDKVDDALKAIGDKLPKRELDVDYNTPKGQYLFRGNHGTHGTDCSAFWGNVERKLGWGIPVILLSIAGLAFWFLVAMWQDLGGLPLPTFQELLIIVPILAIIVAIGNTVIFAIQSAPRRLCLTNVRVVMPDESELEA